MSIISKIAIGAFGVGGIAGGSILLARNLSNEDTLASKLESEGFIPMGTGDTQWSNTLIEYNKVKGVAEEVFKTSSVDLTIEQLKNQCLSILKSGSYSKTDKNKASRWCTIPITIQTRIEKQGRRILNDVDNKQDDKDTWVSLVQKHLTTDENKRMPVSINALQDGTVDDTRINAMKDGCRKLKSKTSLEKTYLDDYSKFHDWCSVPK
ncbi:hypothetical protein MHC_01890 [Mycoplasma haemocanis str. Illinois]|uniref:Uncharacterized protein n=1 Tax=Mycoplasma haemocanis (strain Illinois) TaxID=1111676 RepID=H6N6H2_MYCHN|nr:hypothetical protein [Mycoplasma haemocanis]AEW45244.1 hypothetical protein MHC_01890 [Mycoplasma haemocanis str. Illinois]